MDLAAAAATVTGSVSCQKEGYRPKEFKNLPVVEKVADFLNSGEAVLYVVVSDIRHLWVISHPQTLETLHRMR